MYFAPRAMEGRLKLEFASRDGVTEIVDRYQRGPLHIQKILHPHAAFPGMACVYILTVTGGIVQGDRLQTDIVARDGARFTSPPPPPRRSTARRHSPHGIS
jgi:urease accessory protein UreH